jgi:hypothetical protein
MKYVCNFKQYFATCFGFQEAIIRQIHKVCFIYPYFWSAR